MTEWPSTIPLPLVDYGGEPKHSTIASTIENARIQRRNRFRSATVHVAAKWNLDLAQYDAWEAFFQDDLDNGAAQFSIELRHPKTSELATWISRFVGGYSAAYMEGRWGVEADLELIRMVVTDAAALEGWGQFLVEVSDVDEEDVPFVTSEGFYFYVAATGIPVTYFLSTKNIDQITTQGGEFLVAHH